MVTKTVELNIPASFKDEPIFYQIIKSFKVVPNILEASFSTEMGWAIVKIEGKQEELERLFSFLREKGVQINVR
ncbi:MAG: NIL domain-containing protein [Candidatus Omnitrophica bacterium]|nr:NIL domain-containing protein [Candidatus Omnitrophota bacterium]